MTFSFALFMKNYILQRTARCCCTNYNISLYGMSILHEKIVSFTFSIELIAMHPFSLLSRFLIWLYRLFFPQDRMPELFHPPEEQDVNKTIKEKDPMLLPVGNDHSPDAEMMEGKPFQWRQSECMRPSASTCMVKAKAIWTKERTSERGKKIMCRK